MPLVAFAVEAERDHPRLRGERGDRPVGEVNDVRADDENPGAAIRQQAGDLWHGEAKVERRERRARLAGADQEGQEMVGVLAEIRDPLLRPDARGDQRVGDPRGHRVDVRESRRPALESEGVSAPASKRLHARHVRDGGYAFELDHHISRPMVAPRHAYFCSLCASFPAAQSVAERARRRKTALDL
jgi:hypothetical protein